jgi:hypothetical protein
MTVKSKPIAPLRSIARRHFLAVIPAAFGASLAAGVRLRSSLRESTRQPSIALRRSWGAAPFRDQVFEYDARLKADG